MVDVVVPHPSSLRPFGFITRARLQARYVSRERKNECLKFVENLKMLELISRMGKCGKSHVKKPKLVELIGEVSKSVYFVKFFKSQKW